jgi:hypothetical protein
MYVSDRKEWKETAKSRVGEFRISGGEFRFESYLAGDGSWDNIQGALALLARQRSDVIAADA